MPLHGRTRPVSVAGDEGVQQFLVLLDGFLRHARMKQNAKEMHVRLQPILGLLEAAHNENMERQE